MSSRRMIFAAFGAALIGLAAPAPSSAGPSDHGPPFFRPHRQTASPKLLLRRVRQAANVESAASALALERSRNAKVRALATKLDEHAKIMGAALRAVALQGAAPPRNVRPTRSQQQTLEQLRRLREPNFDTRYLNAMRALHEQLSQDLRAYAHLGRAGPVRNFVTQIAPKVDANEKQVMQAQKSL